MTRRWALLFALGLALRLCLLPRWGTFDTEVQKAWAARAATAGLAGIYGPDDREMVRVACAETGSAWGLLTATNLPRTRIDWENGAFVVDYPPGAVLPLHTHPGDHILYVVEGRGLVHVDGEDHGVVRGDSIFVPAELPDGVKTYAEADDPFSFLAVGHPHRHLTATDRMKVVEAER